MDSATFDRIAKLFTAEAARKSGTPVEREVIKVKHFDCRTALKDGTRLVTLANIDAQARAQSEFVTLSWSNDIEHFKDELFWKLFKPEYGSPVKNRWRVWCNAAADRLKQIDERLAVPGLLPADRDSLNRERARLTRQMTTRCRHYRRPEVAACEADHLVGKRYGEKDDGKSPVANRSKQACASYHSDVYVFYKDTSQAPYDFKGELPGLQAAWAEAPMNTFILFMRRQRPSDVEDEVVFTPWSKHPACPTTPEAVVEILLAIAFIKKRPLVERSDPMCERNPWPWWVKLLILLSLLFAILLALVLARQLGNVHEQNTRLTGEVIRLEIRIQELREELIIAREALSALRRRADAAESALAAAEARVRELEAQIASLRARSGLDEPPCMRRTPEDQRPQPAYLFTVELHEAGIVVRPRNGALDELTAWRAPIRASDFDRPLSRAEFARLADPIYNISVERGCRYSVYVQRGRHDSARSYQAQIDAVTDRFYIYEARR